MTKKSTTKAVKKPTKKPQTLSGKASIGFHGRSKKKGSLVYRIGSRWVTKETYQKHTGVSNSILSHAIESQVKGLENKNGFLPIKNRATAKELLNEFLNSKELHPQVYTLEIYITKLDSLNVLKGKRIFVNNTELTFNEMIYFFGKLLDSIGNVFYASTKFKINEDKNTASTDIFLEGIVTTE